MNWIERMSRAMLFIEENITGDIDIETIAATAQTTPAHFQRMFSIITGITPGDYIRHRRLTLAAQEINSTEISIIDAALKYGYETHSSFTKAFTKMHGFAPLYARKSGQSIKAYPPISFTLSIKGDTSMDYKIRDLKKTRLVGKVVNVSSANGENFRVIPAFWNNLAEQNMVEKIISFADRKGQMKGSLIGVCYDFDIDNECFKYMVGVESSSTDIPEGFTETELTHIKYAVFEANGPQPEAIQKTWKRIFSEWFPATKYIKANAAEMEVYLDKEPACKCCEIWIPIEADTNA
ncbi:MAG: AraC family transcriptional regulator [Spirochaetes bacterium]|nr:AraC family transcriptional regulator [Spirochaetota bacterium]MBN2770744.1 AraC family transcriptional regulator [Spirochaetota bacterium]